MLPCPLKIIMVNEASADTKIRVESVSKSFDVDGRRQLVLDDINLTVGEGEFVSIIGPSGCGKSTLLNIVAGLDIPDSGTTSVEGTQGSSSLGQVGYMQQKDLLLPWRSVLNNAALSLELRGVSREESLARASRRLGEFGLTDHADDYPAQLSGGMRQRVALLRATLADTPLLLLDEPFGALDALTRSEMHSWLIGLLANSGKAVVLVTHDVDEAILLSDRVYVMRSDPGRIASQFNVEIGERMDRGIVTSEAFTTLKATLLAALRSDNDSDETQ